MGMRAALHLSAKLHPALDVDRAAGLVNKLPIQAGAIEMPLDDLVNAMYTDKKVLAGNVRFVLLDSIGHAYVESEADMNDARWAFQEMLKHLDL